MVSASNRLSPERPSGRHDRCSLPRSMTLPPQHPLWTGLVVIVPVAVLSATLVYARAHRLAAALLLEAKGLAWVRRRGAIGCLWSTFGVGVVAAVVYGWLLEVASERASLLFRAAGTLAAIS